MTLSEYQEKAALTIQKYNSKDQENFFLGYLGLAGEAGSVLTTLKKLIRDGDGFGTFKDALEQELGDVLWYVSSIASHNNLDLNVIAEKNLSKIVDRFSETELHFFPRLDESHAEKFPDSFIIHFKESINQDQFLEVKMFWEKANEMVELGDALTDNSRDPNNYRFHDVFHLGHIAFLGWSPVIRHL
ncbi:MAG: nucleotide pyrophosphohydrolase, partial [Bacteroidetes bacterium]|nr:nucleotide pyrophosphohydrolase [Bacteroidota bacterium]